MVLCQDIPRRRLSLVHPCDDVVWVEGSGPVISINGGVMKPAVRSKVCDDLVFEDHGVRVFVDPQSLPMIDGTEVDFVKQGLNESFKFRNPQTKAECGCGESFTV